MSRKTSGRKDKKMKIRVQVIVESDDGVGEVVQDLARLERGQLRPEELGLTLAEAKGLLEGLQRTVVERQIAEYSKQQSSCPLCSKQRLHKGSHAIVYRTLFGKIELDSPRLFHCQCQPQPTRSFSPLAELLAERTAPELLYLEAKFASLVSYGLSMKLLEEALPIGAEINAATIRNHTLAVAERLESELGKQDRKRAKKEGGERPDGPGSKPDERSRAHERRRLLDRRDHERIEPATPGHQARQVERRALLLRLHGQTSGGGHGV